MTLGGIGLGSSTCDPFAVCESHPWDEVLLLLFPSGVALAAICGWMGGLAHAWHPSIQRPATGRQSTVTTATTWPGLERCLARLCNQQKAHPSNKADSIIRKPRLLPRMSLHIISRLPRGPSAGQCLAAPRHHNASCHSFKNKCDTLSSLMRGLEMRLASHLQLGLHVHANLLKLLSAIQLNCC